MITIAQWLPHVGQARQAMLDLLTSGVPRHEISIVFSPERGDQLVPTEGELLTNARDTSSADEDQLAYESIAALDNASTHRLPAGAVVTAIGPLADALGQANGETAEAFFSAALGMLGVSAAEAQAYARQLSTGGALVAVRADPIWETIVHGVFRHATNPSLNGPQETEGPDAGRQEADSQRESPGTSIGGLTSGAIPGGWGTAGLDLEGLGDDRLKTDR